MASPLEGLRGFGDFATFYNVASIKGWPYLNFWVEFPPLFPFVSGILFRLAAGREYVYDYLLAILLLLADAGSLLLFMRLTNRLNGAGGERRIWIYLFILVSLAYTWWYFDPLAVFAMLLAITLFFEGRDLAGAGALALGILTKFFPVLVLVMVWRYYSIRRAVLITITTLGIVGVVFAGVYLASPANTRASLASQTSKGSWETVWALLDGNFMTGNFGPLSERLDPAMAYVSRRNPPVIPPLASFIVFGSIGLWAFFKGWKPGSRPQPDERQVLSFLGFAWALMLIWSPGWSPQWVLYLLPLILLTLPDREGLLMAVTLILVNLLEWPVLLSRGLNEGLWLTVPLRTLVFALLALVWYGEMMGGRAHQVRSSPE